MSAIAWTAIQKAIQNWVVRGSGLASNRVIWSLYGSPRPPAPHIVLSVTSVRGMAQDFVTTAPKPLIVATQVVEAVSAAADTLTITDHPYVTADGPFRLITTGTLPGGLELNTDYWIVVSDENTIQIADSFEHTGGNNVARGLGDFPNPITVVDITSAGTGTMSIVPIPPDIVLDEPLEFAGMTVRAGEELQVTAQGDREITIGLTCFAPEGAGVQAVEILTNVMSSLQLNVTALDDAGIGVDDASAFGRGVRLLEGRRGDILEPRAMTELTIYVTSELLGVETTVTSIVASVELQSVSGTPLAAIPVQVTRS